MPKILNAISFVSHALALAEFFEKYGDCPLYREELAKHKLIARAILRKVNTRRAKGNRKDLI